MTQVLVTGSSDGIGRETARRLDALGFDVIVHGRTLARAQAALPGARATPWACDFRSLEAVRAAAAELPAGIGVLINNAGVYARQRELTGDGHELTFQVNHLAHFLLTRLVLPSMSDGSRIINVSSQVHTGGRIDWDDLDGERDFSGYAAYAQSKLANLLFTRELARRESKATVNALHPGVIGTKLLHGGFGGLSGASLEQGAETPVYLASSPEVAGVTGKYFVRRREVEPAAQAQDDADARRLWEISESLVRM